MPPKPSSLTLKEPLLVELPATSAAATVGNGRMPATAAPIANQKVDGDKTLTFHESRPATAAEIEALASTPGSYKAFFEESDMHPKSEVDPGFGIPTWHNDHFRWQYFPNQQTINRIQKALKNDGITDLESQSKTALVAILATLKESRNSNSPNPGMAAHKTEKNSGAQGGSGGLPAIAESEKVTAPTSTHPHKIEVILVVKTTSQTLHVKFSKGLFDDINLAEAKALAAKAKAKAPIVGDSKSSPANQQRIRVHYPDHDGVATILSLRDRDPALAQDGANEQQKALYQKEHADFFKKKKHRYPFAVLYGISVTEKITETNSKDTLRTFTYSANLRELIRQAFQLRDDVAAGTKKLCCETLDDVVEDKIRKALTNGIELQPSRTMCCWWASDNPILKASRPTNKKPSSPSAATPTAPTMTR